MLVIADRVKEYSNSVSTASFVLGGSETGFRTFDQVCSINDTFYYCISHRSANEWEIGKGQFIAPNSIARSVVLSSSNANQIVDFSAGGKDVFITQPAETLDTLVRSSSNVILGSNSSSPSEIKQLTVAEVKSLLNIQLSDITNVISSAVNNRATNNSGVFVPELETDLVAIYNTAKQ